MSSFGEVPLKALLAMLESCAPGYKVKFREHNIAVYYGDLIYPALPRGKHGKRDNPGIQIGKIKSMMTLFKLPAECVNKALPILRIP